MGKYDDFVAPISKEMKIFITIGLMSEDENLRELYVKASKAITAADLLFCLQSLPASEIQRLDKLREKSHILSPKPRGWCNTRFIAAALNFYPVKCPYDKERGCDQYNSKECTVAKYRLKCKKKAQY